MENEMQTLAWETYIRRLVYAVQFRRDPMAFVDAIVHELMGGGTDHSEAPAFLTAIRTALRSTTRLAELIPQETHSESEIRKLLIALQRRLEALEAQG